MKDNLREILKKLYKCAMEDSVKSAYMMEGSGYGVEQALDSILQAVREILPLKEDDRPEITEWLISKDYTKGFNRAIDLINAEIGKEEK